MTNFLRDKGAYVIDADKLGHKAYEYGSKCFDELVSCFGDDIAIDNEDNTKSINRQALGKLVFGSSDKMNELQKIVWPEIRRLMTVEIENLCQNNIYSVVVIEAAVSQH